MRLKREIVVLFQIRMRLNYLRSRCYVVTMCINLDLVSVHYFFQVNAPSNTIATVSKLTIYKMVTIDPQIPDYSNL